VGENISLTPNSEYNEDPQRFPSQSTFSLAVILAATPFINLIYSAHDITVKNSEGKHGIEGKERE
jgi:hypothetical protein